MMGQQSNRRDTPRAEQPKPNWAALRRAMGYNRHYSKIMLIAYGTLLMPPWRSWRCRPGAPFDRCGHHGRDGYKCLAVTSTAAATA
jgi:hypothetical protein